MGLLDAELLHAEQLHLREIPDQGRPDSLSGRQLPGPVPQRQGRIEYIKGWDVIDAFSHENGDYILQFSNNSPFQVQVFNHPIQVRNDDKYTALFLKDQWRMASRLTLNLGVRFAFDQAYVPAADQGGRTVASIYPGASFDRVNLSAWNSVVPRVHAAYDLTNDGKTVVKGGWGRFAAIRGVLDEANYVNPLVMSSTTFRWVDRNGNRDYDPGEANLDPNGPDFVLNTGFTQGILNPDERRRSPTSSAPLSTAVDPGSRRPAHRHLFARHQRGAGDQSADSVQRVPR